MVEKHRFLLLELHECYSTYLMRRDQTLEALEQLRLYQSNTDTSPRHELASVSLKLVCICRLVKAGWGRHRISLGQIKWAGQSHPHT